MDPTLSAAFGSIICTAEARRAIRVPAAVEAGAVRPRINGTGVGFDHRFHRKGADHREGVPLTPQMGRSQLVRRHALLYPFLHCANVVNGECTLATEAMIHARHHEQPEEILRLLSAA